MQPNKGQKYDLFVWEKSKTKSANIDLLKERNTSRLAKLSACISKRDDLVPAPLLLGCPGQCKGRHVRYRF